MSVEDEFGVELWVLEVAMDDDEERSCSEGRWRSDSTARGERRGPSAR